MQEERKILMPHLKDAKQIGPKALLKCTKLVNNGVFGLQYLVLKFSEGVVKGNELRVKDRRERTYCGSS